MSKRTVRFLSTDSGKLPTIVAQVPMECCVRDCKPTTQTLGDGLPPSSTGLRTPLAKIWEIRACANQLANPFYRAAGPPQLLIVKYALFPTVRTKVSSIYRSRHYIAGHEIESLHFSADDCFQT